MPDGLEALKLQAQLHPRSDQDPKVRSPEPSPPEGRARTCQPRCRRPQGPKAQDSKAASSAAEGAESLTAAVGRFQEALQLRDFSVYGLGFQGYGLFTLQLWHFEGPDMSIVQSADQEV